MATDPTNAGPLSAQYPGLAMAAYSFTAGTAERPAAVPGAEEKAAVEGDVRVGPTRFDFKRPEVREEFGRALVKWAREGVLDQKFAAITTATAGGLILPSLVGQPIAATAVNAFRAAYAAYGMTPLQTPSTATLNLPVMDPNAGGVIPDTTTTTALENEPTVSAISLACKRYQSGYAWFSNLELDAVDFDLLGATVPELVYQKELGLESAIATAIMGDATITQAVPTATMGGITYQNLASLNRSLPKRYDQLKVMILSTSTYTAAESLTGVGSGLPILTPDAQNQELKRFNGTPVIRSDYFNPLGTDANGKVIGCLLSLAGFRLRDAGGSRLSRVQDYPGRPDSTGLNLFTSHAYGYTPAAMATLVNPG